MNTLRNKIWLYLSIFSITILAGLWIFQVIFLNVYYEWQKKAELNSIAAKVKKGYEEDNFEQILDEITYDNGVCIEITSSSLQLYSSNSLSRGCVTREYSLESSRYKQDFINSGKEKKKYMLINSRFQNKTLVYALKLDENYYIFINVSLKPIGTTTNILASQLIYVTFGMLFLSFILAYFISKKVSDPIIKIKDTASKMAKGDYNVKFSIKDSIEELDELVDTLNDTCHELGKIEEVRREFLANISHDLKTPLTMIKAYAEMVRDLTYDNKEKREENLNIIIDETERLNLLVNDILELTKLQADVENLHYEKINLNELLERMISKFSYLEDVKGYHFLFQSCEKNIMIYADLIRMEQVVYNLINNAINHIGKDQEVIITISKTKKEYIVEIADHGKGIEQKDIDLIWDKYYKIDKTHKRSLKGTGIGLSIVKNILIKHQFEYGVKSKLNKGTTFYFKIPKEKTFSKRK